MSPERVSPCPECDVGVKVQLEADADLRFSNLSIEDVQQGNYFACPICQIAWDAEDRVSIEFPTHSNDPTGLMGTLNSGKELSNLQTSHYRLLGYNDEGHLMLRDLGDMSFARGGFDAMSSLETELGEVIEVKGSGYPNSVQNKLNALRPGYCLHTTVGLSTQNDIFHISADEECEIVQAVPIEYALDVDYIPEFADDIWNDCFENASPEERSPTARRTLHRGSGPAADVYVFAKGLQDEQGTPLIAAMQRGETHQLELFANNFSGVFTGGVIDVLFIAPRNRPYFAVYSLGGDCIELSHELRSKLGLPVVHQGWDSDRSVAFDIRYNPQYITRDSEGEKDVLIPLNGQNGRINIDDGTVEGDYFDHRPEPHEIVVTVTENGTDVEVARLRAPSSRLNMKPSRTGDAKSSQDETSKTDNSSEEGADTLTQPLSDRELSRLRDIVELQPTSNKELADTWGLSSGSDVYQYLTSYLDDYYYRDSQKYICATDKAVDCVEKYS